MGAEELGSRRDREKSNYNYLLKNTRLNGKVAAVDLGLNNLATVASNDISCHQLERQSWSVK